MTRPTKLQPSSFLLPKMWPTFYLPSTFLQFPDILSTHRLSLIFFFVSWPWRQTGNRVAAPLPFLLGWTAVRAFIIELGEDMSGFAHQVRHFYFSILPFPCCFIWQEPPVHTYSNKLQTGASAKSFSGHHVKGFAKIGWLDSRETVKEDGKEEKNKTRERYLTGAWLLFFGRLCSLCSLWR